MHNKYALAAAVIVAAAVAFYAGTKYGGGSTVGAITPQAVQNLPADVQRQILQALRGSAGGARNGISGGNGGFLAGQVLSKDAQSITIATRDGGSRIVIVSSSTTVEKTVAGSIDDVADGVNVLVVGTANSDGSITAQSVQIRPRAQAQEGQ